MSFHNRYAALDSSPLKALSQLRSLPTEGDKNSLIERLISQDVETCDRPSSSKGGAKSVVHVDDDHEAESGWETVGATKKKVMLHGSLQDGLLSRSGENFLEEGGVVPETAAVTSGPHSNAPTPESDQANGRVDTSVPSGHEELSYEPPNARQDDDKPKKKRRRGKKGGKKVDKKSKHSDEDEASSTTDLETKHPALDLSSYSWLADASGDADSSTGAGKIEEPSPSFAPTKVQDKVDDDFEPGTDSNSGNEPTHVKNAGPKIALAPDDTTFQHRDDDPSHAMTLVSDNQSADSTADTTALAKKKSRKRANKGRNNVQKKRAAQQDRGAKWEYWHVIVVGLMIGVILHGLFRLLKSIAA